jgi:hypothetical protein
VVKLPVAVVAAVPAVKGNVKAVKAVAVAVVMPTRMKQLVSAKTANT